jgi:hypothetical protein
VVFFVDWLNFELMWWLCSWAWIQAHLVRGLSLDNPAEQV